jgi:hypothetical protein
VKKGKQTGRIKGTTGVFATMDDDMGHEQHGERKKKKGDYT